MAMSNLGVKCPRYTPREFVKHSYYIQIACFDPVELSGSLRYLTNDSGTLGHV